jgi:UDP-N-acetyl-2-amino-2-deoxyglucuronate dehydrogenase
MFASGGSVTMNGTVRAIPSVEIIVSASSERENPVTIGDGVKFAIVGAGNIGALHALAIQQIPSARLCAVCDTDEARARNLAEEFGARWTTDLEELVSQPDIEVVNVCTPSGLHMDIAIAAAEAGKHVMVEKPIEITLSRADRIIEAARKHRVTLGVFFPSRFTEGVRVAQEAIKVGRLGRLVLCDAYVKWYRTQEYYDRGGWRGTWALDGGGALMNQAIHTIDLLQWLGGPIENVCAHTRTLAHRMETEDTAVAIITYRSGALGVIQATTSAWPGQPSRLEISGDMGTVVLEEGIITRWKLADARPGEEEAMLNLERSPGSGASDPVGISHPKHQKQIEEFITAVREHRPPLVDGGEGRKAVEIIHAIYRAAETGRVVSLPLAIEDSL